MPPRKKQPAAGTPIPVDATIHGDKRSNLPTADAYEFVSDEIEQPKTLLYPRDPTLDPQLVWRGKDEQDRADLEVEAPPIYIQEKIDPRVLIENLRATARVDEVEPEFTLFDSFDGLPDLDLVDFYRHDANWSNRMILGDSLQVMASLAEREALRGKIQMIYMDPPYGIKFGSNWQVSARKREVSDGKLDDASREVEQIKAFRDTWELGIHSYLTYLRDRLEVAKDLVSESGSIFVQIGDQNLHLVRTILDEVFGSENFISLVAVKKTAGATTRYLPGVTDFILWYGKDTDQTKFREVWAPANRGVAEGYRWIRMADGTARGMTAAEARGETALPPDARIYSADALTSQSVGREKGEGAASWFQVEINGRHYNPGLQSRWKTNESGMSRLLAAGRVHQASNSLRFVRYADDFPYQAVTNLWTDTGTGNFTEQKIYVVQTSSKIVERCMLMTTDPGDLVFDPTCGSGTTAYVAESWGRRWITIDTSRVALTLARQRLMGARFPYYLLADSAEGRKKEEELTGQVFPATDPTKDIRHGFVCDRVQHITLRSIAQNPEITEGMSQEQVDLAIRRHAEFELLCDRPYEDSKRVRVSGPFTVESLSPHRSLAFATASEPASEREAALDPTAPNFEQTVLANLAQAGIQNGRRKERLEFDLVEVFAGAHIQAVGIRNDPPDGTPGRVGLSIGPQYGTVGPGFIKDAAREAIRARDIDLLCVLGFAFDPTALGATDEANASDEGFANVAAERRLGRVPVLLVRMNADLVMGEELKKTSAGNLFTVFGEPDLDISPVEDGQLVVKIRGVDVYDPTTGDIRSDTTDQIALWMIDTNYNGESFFVRHCYFTGGQDPYKRLKAALKAEIDEDAWASLYQTESRPFARPDTGKIAVKVINDYGDEVMKVFAV
jgi:adenine-specific DNA-methyltransferase